MKNDILVVGSGGREHALVWKLADSPEVGCIYAAPGNGGTSRCAINVPIASSDAPSLLAFAKKKNVHLTVVGPDDALARGIADLFRANGMRSFGPTLTAARLESSKSFAKSLMATAGVPTAAHQTFSDRDRALDYVNRQNLPVVIKADGLALGKGVYVCRTLADAEEALAELMIRRVHGSAADRVIVEECLRGRELSLHAFCDGRTFAMFPPSQDHKAAFDGGLGPNTGGMGTLAPIDWVTPEWVDRQGGRIIQPILEAIKSLGHPFVGCLYPGVMLTADGAKVLEYNSRFGDPETQSYMRLLKTDLLTILDACVDGQLSSLSVEW